ncbi:MAG TPA: sulfite exporter TauE/SafE family protein [Gaiellaceae bacterium]|nr:sulfite exporter TauE/SafE family protein [Gaiellaceae bacterium]
MTVVLVILVGLGGGVLAGTFGVGGGIVFVPTLALGLGLTQIHAQATSLLAILPTAAVGTWRQVRLGNVDVRAAIYVGVASIVGVQGGVLVAESLPEHALRRLFGAFLIVTALQIAWRVRQRDAA